MAYNALMSGYQPQNVMMRGPMGQPMMGGARPGFQLPQAPGMQANGLPQWQTLRNQINPLGGGWKGAAQSAFDPGGLFSKWF